MSASSTSGAEGPAPGADDVPETVPSEALQGKEAAELGRALLLQATGANNIDDANRVALRHHEPDTQAGGPDGVRPPGPGAKL